MNPPPPDNRERSNLTCRQSNAIKLFVREFQSSHPATRLHFFFHFSFWPLWEFFPPPFCFHNVKLLHPSVFLSPPNASQPPDTNPASVRRCSDTGKHFMFPSHCWNRGWAVASKSETRTARRPLRLCLAAVAQRVQCARGAVCRTCSGRSLRTAKNYRTRASTRCCFLFYYYDYFAPGSNILKLNYNTKSLWSSYL